ncbi:MAG: class I SAM-dependent methyltransferase [Chloroflexi bacterium]|nr:class I SAM-dependent methyltransferase [Chloroflexota bacterium]MBU1750704.1 class I SAM-dependent methyltransferase [Chloroflexota bacterium]
MSDPEISYFALQAYVGTTKHMGGLETTQELVELCHIGRDSYVLDVGCGVGATACYLVKTHGCRVVGVDASEAMVARSNERAQQEGVTDRVEFRVADVCDLPFDDGRFDAVLVESVLTFVADKQQAIRECVRVTRCPELVEGRPGGYVGLNEQYWIQTPPASVLERVRHTFEIQPGIPMLEGWTGWMENAGLVDVAARPYHFDARRESSQVKRYRFRDMWRMAYRTVWLYMKSPDFRRYMAGRKYRPKDLFDYLGYALFIGRK